jgi:hypothetical protein
MSEKYLRKLTGKTEIEDALKRLDKLTNEEVRMAVAVGIDGVQPFSISYRENTLNSYIPRGGSSQTSVIFFPLTLVCRLKHHHREPITPGPFQMALSAGSVY